jgi:hypothetical protein
MVHIGCVAQGAMNVPQPSRIGHAVGRRSDQRMAASHLCPDLDQLCCLRGAGRLGRDPETLDRAPQESNIPDRLGCRGEEEPPRLGRKQFEAQQESALNTAGDRHRGKQAETARKLRRSPPSRQLSGPGE